MSRPNKRKNLLALRLETLEDRTVPAGVLGANAFHDANANGVRDPLEVGVANVNIMYSCFSPPSSGSMTTTSAGTASATLSAADYSWSAMFPSGYSILVPFATFGTKTVVDGQQADIILPLVQSSPPGGGGSGGPLSGSAAIESDTGWVYRGDEVTFWAYSTIDPAPAYSQIQWDFNYNGLSFVPDASANGDTTQHTFNTNGTYNVAAKLTKQAGGFDLATLSVTVHHLAPVVMPPENLTATAGEPFDLEWV